MTRLTHAQIAANARKPYADRIMQLESDRAQLVSTLSELVAEWDVARAHEDHRSGITPDTGGIAVARIVLRSIGEQ